MKIEIIDPIECRVSKADARRIKPSLTYTGVYYRKERIPGTDRKRMVRHEYPKECFSAKEKDHWYFLRGHLDRVQKYLDEKGISYKLTWANSTTITPGPFMLDGIQFRPDQLALMNNAVRYDDQNGVIVAPTGSGKTILQLGIRSAFPNHRTLFLAHTIGIVQQTVDELIKFGFHDVQQIGGGKKYRLLRAHRSINHTIVQQD